MAMFALPKLPDNTVLKKVASKLAVSPFTTNTQLDAILAVWRTAVEAETAPGARNLGMSSGATVSTFGYASTDDVVLNEKTITALGERTAVTTAALANPTMENIALVYNLIQSADAEGTGETWELNESGSLPTFAFCRDFVTLEIDENGNGVPTWTRAIFAEANAGTDDSAFTDGAETNIVTLPLSIRATARTGYKLVEIKRWPVAA